MIYLYKSLMVKQQGFTLIELLIVMVLLGITSSLLAPDMYSLLKRTQAKTEITKIQALAQLSIERSFFSASNIELIFDRNTLIIRQASDNTIATNSELSLDNENKAGTNPYNEKAAEQEPLLTNKMLIKKITSKFFTFEKKRILIMNGQWQGSRTLTLLESSIKSLNKITLVVDESNNSKNVTGQNTKLEDNNAT